MIANKRTLTLTWTCIAAAIILLFAVPCAGKDQSGIYVGGGILCTDTPLFALCTSASCTPDKSDATIANCDCVVAKGPNWGTTKCEDREKELLSTFSPIQAGKPDNYKALFCNSPQSAACLDAPCTIDKSSKPPTVKCKCKISDQTPWFTLGGGCDTAKCDQLWSAGYPGKYFQEVITAFRKLGVSGSNFPKCNSK